MIFIAAIDFSKVTHVKKIKHGSNIFNKNYICFGINRSGTILPWTIAPAQLQPTAIASQTITSLPRQSRPRMIDSQTITPQAITPRTNPT